MTEAPKTPENTLSPPDYARFLVMLYVKDLHQQQGEPFKKFADNEVFVVWFSKTLENWKALVGTCRADGDMYYEVTHNGVKGETYVDAYAKVDNVCYPD